MPRPTYVTSYCNHPHYLDTGRPIGHECYIIPPKALALERDDRVAEAIDVLWAAKQIGLSIVRGQKHRETA